LRSTTRSRAGWKRRARCCHVAAATPSGVRIVEVWESREAVARFREMALPIVTDLDLPRAAACPQIDVVHRVLGPDPVQASRAHHATN
jgi:hypothetical protein